MEYQNLIKNRKINIDKLISYGFILKNSFYIYETYILDKEFKLDIYINNKGEIKTRLIELLTYEEYTLYKTNYNGEYVIKIRNEIENIILDIISNCYEMQIFKNKQSLKVIDYVLHKYKDKIEYLWEKFPTNAIIRRIDNHKWYLILMKIEAKKLDISRDDEFVEIIDLRNNISNLDNSNIYPGYHMNKKNWISIILDYSIDDDLLFKLIDESYLRAK